MDRGENTHSTKHANASAHIQPLTHSATCWELEEQQRTAGEETPRSASRGLMSVRVEKTPFEYVCHITSDTHDWLQRVCETSAEQQLRDAQAPGNEERERCLQAKVVELEKELARVQLTQDKTLRGLETWYLLYNKAKKRQQDTSLDNDHLYRALHRAYMKIGHLETRLAGRGEKPAAGRHALLHEHLQGADIMREMDPNKEQDDGEERAESLMTNCQIQTQILELEKQIQTEETHVVTLWSENHNWSKRLHEVASEQKLKEKLLLKALKSLQVKYDRLRKDHKQRANRECRLQDEVSKLDEELSRLQRKSSLWPRKRNDTEEPTSRDNEEQGERGRMGLWSSWFKQNIQTNHKV